MVKLLKKEFVLSMHPVTPFMLVLAAMVLSVYYPGRWGFYGYAMNVRYGMSQDNSVHVQLSFDMGRWYLLIVTMLICIAGILFIRRKDVLKNE